MEDRYELTYEDFYGEDYGDQKFYECPECNHSWYQKEARSYEGADADGNRSIWVVVVECPKCGYDGD